MSKPQAVVWDSCVIVDAIQKTPGKYGDIEPCLQDARDGQLRIVVSEISVAEVCALKGSTESIDEQVRLIRDWFEQPYVTRRIVHPGISELAANLNRQHASVKVAADAIVLATAVFYKIRWLHTWDGAGRKKGLIDLDGKVGDPLIKISPPQHHQQRLPFSNGQEVQENDEQEPGSQG